MPLTLQLDEAGVRDFGNMLLQQGTLCPIKSLSCDHFEVKQQTTSMAFDGKPVSSSVLTLLFGILKRNETIEIIDLTSAGMDVAATMALETALADNHSLTSLDLRGNETLWGLAESDEGRSSAAIESLARGLQSNDTISKVHVDAFELQVQVLTGRAPTLELHYPEDRKLSDLSAAVLCTLIEKNPAAKSLDLSKVKTAGQLGHAVGRCLKGNTALVAVRLQESDLGNEGASALATGLTQNSASAVRSLDLSSNSIGEEGAQQLAALLSASTSLTRLDLTSNKLGARGTRAVMVSLHHNSTLTALSLRDNDVMEPGAAAVAAALEINGTLSTLWLGKNRIGDEGVVAIASALVANKQKSQIAILDLHKNGTTKVGHASLTQLLNESLGLTALGLAGAKMQFTETEAMQSAAKEKPEIGRAKAVRLWMGSDMNKWPVL